MHLVEEVAVVVEEVEEIDQERGEENESRNLLDVISEINSVSQPSANSVMVQQPGGWWLLEILWEKVAADTDNVFYHVKDKLLL